MSKYNHYESGKTHNKFLHTSKKYKDNFSKDPDDCTHRFNDSACICVHCGMHRDELMIASGVIPDEF